MNGADFLRGLFGIRQPKFPSDGNNGDLNGPDHPHEPHHGHGNEGPPFHGFFWSGGWNSRDGFFGSHQGGHEDGGQDGFHGSWGGEGSLDSPQDIFSHFDDVFRHFDQLFSHSFERMPFGALPGIRSEDEDKPEQRSPRDFMLKQPDQDLPEVKQPQPDSVTPHGFFGSIFGPPERSLKKEDRDLDKEVKDGDLSFLFKDKASDDPNMKSLIPMVPSAPEGHVNRVQIYSFTNRNGTKEEKRTYKDETGTEVTTVTRSLGPQQYSHTTKTHPDGRKENTEDYINISDREKDNFTRNWSNQAQGHGANVETGKHIGQYVKDLFRIGFTGFPTK